MSVFNVVYQLISLFLMMAVGFASAKIGIITPDFRKRLSGLIIQVACPCIIISSVLDSDTGSVNMLPAFGVAILYFTILVLSAWFLVRLFRISREDFGLTELLLVFSNQAFMGIPIIQAFYGITGVAYLSMFILLFNLMFFTYGIYMINGGVELSWKLFVNSGIISGLLALFFGLTGLHLPTPLEGAISSIGAVNTPMAMMITGASLAHSDIKAALSRLYIYKLSFLKLMLMPFLMLCVMYFLPIPPMLMGISVLLAAMPIAANCGMLSDMYRKDDMTAAHAIILTTLLSAVTLPLVSAVLTLFA